MVPTKPAGRNPLLIVSLIVLVSGLLSTSIAFASKETPAAPSADGEALYKQLLYSARGESGDMGIFDALDTAGDAIDWATAEKVTFLGNLRILEVPHGAETKDFFLIRSNEGAIFVLTMPDDAALLHEGADSPYAGIAGKVEFKLQLVLETTTVVHDGTSYTFARLMEPPERLFLDRLFFIAIVVLLFLTMVGMGLTLTIQDFGMVLKKPLGMIIGMVLQFGLLPLVAMALGRLFGFYDAYPFIFLGLILVASSPGGVTSNLLTYLGKGDVALSVSLTALCTVMSIIMTPLLISLYVANIPDFDFPVFSVVKTMLVLVIVPLVVGMLVRGKWEKLAKKLEKPFAIIGIFALLFLIIVGVWSNLDKFADTDRYGVAFYGVIFLLTFLGMVLSAGLSKLARIDNFKTRAISLEVGIRNASLAMTIAILLQDAIGDFSSSMFFSSGIFGLWMYIAGAIVIFLFPKVLPVGKASDASAVAPDVEAPSTDERTA